MKVLRSSWSGDMRKTDRKTRGTGASQNCDGGELLRVAHVA